MKIPNFEAPLDLSGYTNEPGLDSPGGYGSDSEMQLPGEGSQTDKPRFEEETEDLSDVPYRNGDNGMQRQPVSPPDIPKRQEPQPNSEPLPEPEYNYEPEPFVPHPAEPAPARQPRAEKPQPVRPPKKPPVPEVPEAVPEDVPHVDFEDELSSDAAAELPADFTDEPLLELEEESLDGMAGEALSEMPPLEMDEPLPDEPIHDESLPEILELPEMEAFEEIDPVEDDGLLEDLLPQMEEALTEAFEDELPGDLFDDETGFEGEGEIELEGESGPEGENGPEGEIELEGESGSDGEIELEDEAGSGNEIELEGEAGPEMEPEAEPESGTEILREFAEEFMLDDDFELSALDHTALDHEAFDHEAFEGEMPSPVSVTFEKAQLLSPPRFTEALEEMSGNEMLGLFKFLKTITLALPEEKLSNYLFSDERIKMEYVIDRLSGKSGLKNDSRINRIRSGIGKKSETANGTDFGKTLDFLEAMVTGLPDQGFAVTFKNKLENIRIRYNENS